MDKSSLELRLIPADGSPSRPLTEFLDYEINHELLTADGAFAINIMPMLTSSANMPIMGDVAELLVQGQLVLSGWIESVSRQADKQGGRQYAIYGRSKSAILVDNAILPDGGMWAKHENVSLAAFCNQLLAQLPAEHRPKLVNVPEAASLSVEISPGDTYWDVMTRIATARGCYFVCQSDGTIIFSTLNEIARPTAEVAPFAIELGTSTANALSGSITRDMAKRYANIIVISQDAEGSRGTVIYDDEAIFPRSIVVNPEQDGQNIDDYGRLYLAKQVKDSMQYEYTVEGHEQNGNVWAIGAACSVKDVLHGIEEVLLICGITFTLSKQEGRRTVVRLCPYFAL